MNQPDDKWIDAAATLPPMDHDNSWADQYSSSFVTINVLLQTKDGDITVGYAGQYDEGPVQWFIDVRDSYLIEEGVAYWQPLPEPRKV